MELTLLERSLFRILQYYYYIALSGFQYPLFRSIIVNRKTLQIWMETFWVITKSLVNSVMICKFHCILHYLHLKNSNNQKELVLRRKMVFNENDILHKKQVIYFKQNRHIPKLNKTSTEIISRKYVCVNSIYHLLTNLSIKSIHIYHNKFSWL